MFETDKLTGFIDATTEINLHDAFWSVVESTLRDMQAVIERFLEIASLEISIDQNYEAGSAEDFNEVHPLT